MGKLRTKQCGIVPGEQSHVPREYSELPVEVYLQATPIPLPTDSTVSNTVAFGSNDCLGIETA